MSYIPSSPLLSLQKGSHAFNCRYRQSGVPYQLWYLQLRRAQPEYHHSHTISESHSLAGSSGSWTGRNCLLGQRQWFGPGIAIKRKKSMFNNCHIQLKPLQQRYQCAKSFSVLRSATTETSDLWTSGHLAKHLSMQTRFNQVLSAGVSRSVAWTINRWLISFHADVSDQTWQNMQQYRLLPNIIIILKGAQPPGQPWRHCHCFLGS